MRIRVLSDLHLDAPNLGNIEAIKQGGEDVVVCAGDLSNGGSGLFRLRDCFPQKRILFVPGNHEYYDCLSVEDQNYLLIENGKRHNIEVLINDTREVDGVKFIGSTLWTDFGLYQAPRIEYKNAAERWINDFRQICFRYNKRLSADDVYQMFQDSVAFITHEITPSRSVVITHFAPHPNSVAKQYKGDPVTPYFVSNLSDLIALTELWIHGHTHTFFDYTVGSTRVVSNPSGYRREVTGFKPDFVVEI